MPLNAADYQTFAPQPSYTHSPAQRPFTPADGIYPAALNGISAGELSSDSMRQPSPSFVLRHARRNSGTQSPLSSSSGLASVPRAAHRYNPIAVASPPTRAATRAKARRGKSDDFDSDGEDEPEYPPSVHAPGTDARREEIRRQRIESEQRRRDELRDGYRRLKDALPVSNQKSSKVCLLDRATTHIKYLEMTNQQLQARVQQAEAEVQRLRQSVTSFLNSTSMSSPRIIFRFNETLMLRSAESHHAAASAAAAAAASQAVF